MNKSKYRVLSFAAVLSLSVLLAGVPVAYADPQQLNLSISGGIISSGNQQYTQSGGQVAFASIFGKQVDPSSVSWSDVVVVSVQGLTVNGNAHFTLTGTFVGGGNINLRGTVQIQSSIPAEQFPQFPSDCTVSNTCTSAVPAFFLGSGSIDVTTTSSSQHTLPMALESPFLNPFGNPIVLSSLDNPQNPSIVIVATYIQAGINWQGIRTGGPLSGTLNGNQQVSGSFLQVANAREDLFAGTETGSGTLTFSNMNPSSLNAAGTYTDRSTIPTAGAIDCSSFTTGIAGTCTETGFNSAGQFSLSGSKATIQGTYSLQWAVPALTFAGTATASVQQH